MGEKVRISDIAQRAGVSIATVSRVLNEPDRVRAGTRDQVYAVMRALKYVPPTVHRDPETLSNIIGVFAPNLFLDSLTELVRAVEAELTETTFDILLVNMRGNRNFAGFIQTNPHILKKVDAAIVFSADVSADAVDYMKSADVPLVLLQARCKLVRSVSNNNFLGGQDAATHLLECGYRRIAFVGWEPWDDHVADRLAGFRSTLTRFGIPFHDEDIAYGALSADGGYTATARLLEKNQPDAVFYACDMMAVGGLKQFRERGVAVPDAVGVMGFDDLSIAGAIGLTTMRQYFSKKAQMIVEYLVGRLSGDIRTDQPEELQISPGLVVRDTTRPVSDRKPLPPRAAEKR
ncbi:MAG: LacI family DNA-binding transcriptional regulator [Spirochaeta sp.]|jgi:LacI family transcriptional regulator|nr:LacI family DNA-binding transcriptional regulator [Spirochaeta sp.]